MSFVIDTNIIIHSLKGTPEAEELITGSDLVIVPSIVVGELEYGFRLSKNYRKNKANLKYFIAATK